ncbi:MAG: DoxX family protein [Geodermatophilaceae bacterium]|nr:DoxX family protein [Geodermatophilaceae bacterium]
MIGSKTRFRPETPTRVTSVSVCSCCGSSWGSGWPPTAHRSFGLFGGGGIDGTAQFFEGLGFSPGTPYAILSGLVEFGGGLLITVGLALPLAAAAVVANMVGAYAAIQASTEGDFFAGTGGPELELLYVGAAFALILTGPGRLAMRVPALDGPKMRLLGAVLAIVGGIAAVVVFHL